MPGRPYHRAMRDLYQRLSEVGFERDWLLNAVLPVWWDDSLADEPANRELAEFRLARFLGLTVETLRQPDKPLVLRTADVRFKTTQQKTESAQVTASAAVAHLAGQMLVELLDDSLPRFECCLTAEEVRSWILSRYTAVDLESLLSFCWQHGIIVFPFAEQPKKSRHLDGMAMFHQERPAIMLGSKRKHPAWFVFPLAHELGHILRRHVSPGERPLADADLERQGDTDAVEDEANQFALSVMVGSTPPSFARPFKYINDLRPCLLELAMQFNSRPSILALIYGKATGGWPHAQAIVSQYESGETAQAILRAALRGKISAEELTEDSYRFLDAVTAIAA